MDKLPETYSLAFKRKHENKQSDNYGSRVVNPYLEAEGYKFQEEKVFITGENREYFYIADFYLPKPYYMVIEVDGEYHNEPKQKLIDSYKNEYYTITRRFRFIRVTNSWFKNNKDEFKDKVEGLKNAPRGSMLVLP